MKSFWNSRNILCCSFQDLLVKSSSFCFLVVSCIFLFSWFFKTIPFFFENYLFVYDFRRFGDQKDVLFGQLSPIPVVLSVWRTPEAHVSQVLAIIRNTCWPAARSCNPFWNMRTGSDPTSHARILKMTLMLVAGNSRKFVLVQCQDSYCHHN